MGSTGLAMWYITIQTQTNRGYMLWSITNKSKPFHLWVSTQKQLSEISTCVCETIWQAIGRLIVGRRLAHASNWTIRDTIKCAIGLESLKRMTFDTHVKFPSCIVGKATMEDFPKANRPTNKSLYQVHMESFSSSVKSIQGYIHAIVFVDAATGYRWIYGMKTNDDIKKCLEMV